MNTEEGRNERFQTEIASAEVIAGLRHTLDLHYRRLCQAARADWERLFGSDPSDACVKVRVTATEPTAIRGSGFLKSRRSAAKTVAKTSVPGFAH